VFKHAFATVSMREEIEFGAAFGLPKHNMYISNEWRELKLKHE
jgi:hypothetical protein